MYLKKKKNYIKKKKIKINIFLWSLIFSFFKTNFSHL